MKKTTLTISAMLATLCLLSQPVFANILSDPNQCPSVEALKSVALNYVAPDEGRYTAVNINNYGTPQDWVFGVGYISADSTADALKKAQTALTTLSGKPIPLFDASENMWMCIYNNNAGYITFAVTQN
jgi:hypothetical protein